MNYYKSSLKVEFCGRVVIIGFMKKIIYLISGLAVIGLIVFFYRLSLEVKTPDKELGTHCKDLSVVMFMSPYCKYCTMAKSILNSYGIDYRLINVQDNAESREKMQKITGQSSVPQIFIEGKHIGGYSQLKELDDDGRLKKFLKTCNISDLSES